MPSIDRRTSEELSWRTTSIMPTKLHTHHDKLMEASPAYRNWHTRRVQVAGPDIAKTIAAGVAQQCNAWPIHLFDGEKCPYPAGSLLEEVIKELQARV